MPDAGTVTVQNSWDEVVGHGHGSFKGSRIVVSEYKSEAGALRLSDSYPYTVTKADNTGWRNVAFVEIQGGAVHFNAEYAVEF